MLCLALDDDSMGGQGGDDLGFEVDNLSFASVFAFI